MVNNLLVSLGWIVDVVVLIVLLVNVFSGARVGLIEGLGRLGGKLFAIGFAFMFCISFEMFLENTFGMTTAISNGIVDGLLQKPALAVPLDGTEATQSSLQALLPETPPFIIAILTNILAGQSIPAGTTGASLLGTLFAKWIAIAISFVLLIIIMRWGVLLVAKVLSGIVNVLPIIGLINRFLGAILGAAKGALTVFILLMLCNWLNIGVVESLLMSSPVVGVIYRSEWFMTATNAFTSFEWLKAFLDSRNTAAWLVPAWL